MVAQSVIGSVTVIIIYYLAKKIFDVRTAMLSAFLASVYPLYLYYCGFILGETLVILLFLLFLLLIVLFIEDRDMEMLGGSGVIFTMLIHTDPRFLFHLPIVPLYLGVGLSDRRNGLKTSSILILGVILCSIPWAVRNHAVYKDRFVLINTRTLDTWAKRSVINVAAKSEGKDGGVSIQKPTTLEAFEELKKKSLVSAEYAHSIKAPRFARIFSEEERMAFERGVRPSFSVAGLYLHHFTLVLATLCFAAAAASRDPEADLKRVQQRIGELQRSVREDVARRDKEAAALRQAEEQVAAARGRLDDVRGRIRDSDRRLRELEEERGRQQDRLEAQRDELASALRAAYVAGKEEHLKLLLGQKDPAALGRVLVYYSYFGKARAGRIAEIEDAVARIATVAGEEAAEREKLAALEKESEGELANLDAAREQREKALAEARDRIRSNKDAIAKLRRARRRRWKSSLRTCAGRSSRRLHRAGCPSRGSGASCPGRCQAASSRATGSHVGAA